MRRGRLALWLVATAVIVVAVVGTVVAGARPQLGLDLRGGISAIYSPVLPEGEERPEDFDEVLDETIQVIRERVDSLGVAEPNITRQGDDVLVQLPGLEDPERARQIIGTTAKLTFRPVRLSVPPGTPVYEELPECGTAGEPAELLQGLGVTPPTGQPGPSPEPGDGTPGPEPTATGAAAGPGDAGVLTAAQSTPTPSPAPDETDTQPDVFRELEDDESGVLCGTGEEEADGEGDAGAGTAANPVKYVVGPSALGGEAVDEAFAQLTERGWVVSLGLAGEGPQQFAAITGQLACERDQGQTGLLAIVLDNRVESAPQMNPSVQCGVGITGGQAEITVGSGEEQEDEARDLALVLKTGALPITLEPSTFQTISPTLGIESLRSGLLAAGIGLLLVALYLVFFYRWLGLVAIGALTVFGVLMYGLITALGAVGFSLTLAGIAGIVVAIGITADSSIIFFERVRDEARVGKTMRSGVHRAFRSAFRTNLAGNTVTLAAAMILYLLAVGPVRGFALTLGFATVLDIIILYGYTRPAVWLMSRRRGLLTRRSIRAEVTGTAATAGGGSS